jgi:hypothetical protein
MSAETPSAMSLRLALRSALAVAPLALLLAFAVLPASAQKRLAAAPPDHEALDRAVRGYTLPFTTAPNDTVWKARWTDVNGDDLADALVYVAGPDWCGSGGCTLLVFEAVSGPDADELGPFRAAAEVSLVSGPVLVADAGPDGWRDLVVTDMGGDLRVLRFDGETYPGSPDAGVAVNARPEGDLIFAESN